MGTLCFFDGAMKNEEPEDADTTQKQNESTKSPNHHPARKRQESITTTDYSFIWLLLHAHPHVVLFFVIWETI
jgi:hypothetical protein